MASRESEDLGGNDSGISLTTCSLCNHVISEVRYLYKPQCGHPLHKSCYQKNVKTKPNCSLCNQKLYAAIPSSNTNIPPPMITRSLGQIR